MPVSIFTKDFQSAREQRTSEPFPPGFRVRGDEKLRDYLSSGGQQPGERGEGQSHCLTFLRYTLTGAAHAAIVQPHSLLRTEVVLVEVRVGELGARQRSLGHPLDTGCGTLQRLLLKPRGKQDKETDGGHRSLGRPTEQKWLTPPLLPSAAARPGQRER